MFDLQYIKNVATLKLNPDECNGCRMCIIVCPHEVFKMEEKRAVITGIDSCMECGACALNCPTSAITVNSGVGCAAAVINGMIKGTEASCGCGGDGDSNTSDCC